MQQHNLSRTQPRTMSDGDICSDDKKYMMANSLCCQEKRQEERERCTARSLSVFATKTADVAASRAPAGKNPPHVTLIDKSKTSSGKRVANNITLATARTCKEGCSFCVRARSGARAHFSRQSPSNGGSKGKPCGDSGVANELPGPLVQGARAVRG
jgi:hypothetical protein